MKPILFTMGGAGNVFYQYNYVSKVHGDNFLISNILYTKIFKTLLSHTAGFPNHQQPSRNANIFMLIVYIPLFLLDLMLVKLFKISFVTNFDSTNIKVRPKLKALVYFGYFQSNSFSPFSPIISADIFLVSKETKASSKVCIHIRGGDYLVAYGDNNLNTNMPLPSATWYKDALNLLFEDNQVPRIIDIVTDDLKFANEIYLQLQPNFTDCIFNIVSESFESDLKTLLSTEYLIIHNSTFALMAAESNPFIKKTVISDYMKSKCLSNELISKSSFLNIS